MRRRAGLDFLFLHKSQVVFVRSKMRIVFDFDNGPAVPRQASRSDGASDLQREMEGESSGESEFPGSSPTFLSAMYIYRERLVRMCIQGRYMWPMAADGLQHG